MDANLTVTVVPYPDDELLDDWWDYALIIGCGVLLVIVCILVIRLCLKPKHKPDEDSPWDATPLTKRAPSFRDRQPVTAAASSTVPLLNPNQSYHPGGDPHKKLILKKDVGQPLGIILQRPPPLEVCRCEGAVAHLESEIQDTILTKIDGKRVTLGQTRAHMSKNKNFTLMVKTLSKEHLTFPITRPTTDSPLGLVLHEALVIKSVVPKSPAAVAGVGSFIGWEVTHVNGVELSSIDAYDNSVEKVRENKILSLGLKKRLFPDLVPSSAGSSSRSSSLDELGRTLSTLPDFPCEPETYPDDLDLPMVVRSLGFTHLVKPIKSSQVTISTATENSLNMVGATVPETSAILAAIGKGAHVFDMKKDLAAP